MTLGEGAIGETAIGELADEPTALPIVEVLVLERRVTTVELAAMTRTVRVPARLTEVTV